MTPKKQNRFSGTSLVVSSPVAPLAQAKTRAEEKTLAEYRKQTLVMRAQRDKSFVAFSFMRDVYVHACAELVHTVEEIEVLRTPNGRNEAQKYVDDFAEHLSLTAGHHLSGAADLGIRNIVRELDRDLYFEDVPPGWLDRLRGRR
jgi:hypothetical protein